MKRNSQRYLALMLIGFLPSLSGCLGHYALKADVDYDGSSAPKSEESKDSEDKGSDEMRL